MGGTDWEIGVGWRIYIDWTDWAEYRIGWIGADRADWRTGRNTGLDRILDGMDNGGGEGRAGILDGAD